MVALGKVRENGDTKCERADFSSKIEIKEWAWLDVFKVRISRAEGPEISSVPTI